MAKNKETTTDGQAGAEAPALPPQPPTFLTPALQRLADAATGIDGAPIWSTSTSYSDNPFFLSHVAQQGYGGPAAPAAYPPAPTPPPTASPPSPKTATAPLASSPWAAANPLARPDAPPRFGDDLRSDIFRQIYRTGKHNDTAAGAMLMNIGKPPVPATDPLAGLGGPVKETPEPPRYLDNSGNTTPPAENMNLSTTYGAPQAPQASGPSGRGVGPGGRLAARMQGRGGQGMTPMNGGPTALQPSPRAHGPAFAPMPPFGNRGQSPATRPSRPAQGPRGMRQMLRRP